MDTPTGFPLPYWPLSEIIFKPDYVSGDSWSFRLFRTDYNSGAWSAKMTFAGGADTYSFPAVLTPSRVFEWLIPGSDTAKMPAQPYRVWIIVSNGTETKTIQQSGTLVIAPLGAGNWTDNASILQQLLIEANATLLKLLRKEVSMVMFQGKQYHLLEVDKLWKLRNEIAARAADEWELIRGNRRAHRIIPVFRNM
jgi:hypothetical protein